MKRLRLPALALALGLGGAVPGVEGNAGDEQVVKVTARRFAYSPAEILVKRGRPVMLEFTSLDFVHGFNVPDLKLRADLPPGKVTRVRFTPERAGIFRFLCDNFCGDRHEDMHGRIVVTE